MALTCAAALATTPAHAQTPIDGLVSDALRHNHLLQAERHSMARSAAGVREARARLLPALALDSRYSEQDGGLNLGDVVNPAYAALNQVIGEPRFPTNLDLTLPQRHESRLRLTQPVFAPAAWAGVSAARHQERAQRGQLGAAARRLAADVQGAYYAALSAARAVQILESALALVRESERVAQRLEAAGSATPDVRFRARAERSDVEQQLAEARERAATAARAVNQLAGRDLEAALPPVADSLLLRPLPVTREAALASALARREELQQLQSGERAAAAAARAASASYLPTIALALDYGVQGRELRVSGDDDFLVGSVVLSWNLFNGGGDAARRSAAQSDAARLRALAADATTRIQLDVLQAYDAADVSRAAIGTAEDRHAAAQRAWTFVRRRWEEGLASHIELVDARADLTAAELNRSLTLYRYATRLAELERAAALRKLTEN